MQAQADRHTDRVEDRLKIRGFTGVEFAVVQVLHDGCELPCQQPQP